MKTTNKVGDVVAVMVVKEDNDVMIMTADGKIIRIEADKIRKTGRSTQGVKLVNMEEGDKVAATSVVSEPDTPADGEQELPLQ